MRRAAAWLSWFAGLIVLWFLFVGTVQDVERIAGVCAAAIGATAVDVVRSQGVLGFRVERRWLQQTWKPVLRVVPEFLLLMGALVRRPRGSFRTLDFPAGGERHVDAGRRAFAVIVSSLAPNRLVVDVDRETRAALVHDLVPGRASGELP
jgi:hypothetical protein